LVENIVEQEDHVASLLMPMESTIDAMDGGIDEMRRRVLLASIEDRYLIPRPRDREHTTVRLPTPFASKPEIKRPPPIAKLEL